MVERYTHRQEILKRLKQFPVVAILGARQVGKTTLARATSTRHPGPSHWFDLESLPDVARLADPTARVFCGERASSTRS